MTVQQIWLFHVSDRAGLTSFEPRPALHPSARVEGPVVWAVDAEHLRNYLLPRDCPRVTFHAGPASTPRDAAALLGPGGASCVIAVETAWMERIRSRSLVRYEFDPGSFELHDATAGYWISRRPVTPRAEVPLDDLLSALLQEDVELRVMRSLWRLREAVITSSLEFSIIRMRNATPPPEGMEGYHPLP